MNKPDLLFVDIINKLQFKKGINPITESIYVHVMNNINRYILYENDNYILEGKSADDLIDKITNFIMHPDPQRFKNISDKTLFSYKDFSPRIITFDCTKICITDKMEDKILVSQCLSADGTVNLTTPMSVRKLYKRDHVIACFINTKPGSNVYLTNKNMKHLNAYPNLQMINVQNDKYAYCPDIEKDFYKLFLPNRTKSANAI